MAFRATNTLKSMVGRLGGKRSFASSTAAQPETWRQWMQMKGEFAPIYAVLGMVIVAVSIGTHTAKQQLMHSPGVKVSKKKRESIPEVDDPDRVISSADKFINNSFFRKVAHIQDTNPTLPDSLRPNPFTRSRHAETLKSAGVNPSG